MHRIKHGLRRLLYGQHYRTPFVSRISEPLVASCTNDHPILQL